MFCLMKRPTKNRLSELSTSVKDIWDVSGINSIYMYIDTNDNYTHKLIVLQNKKIQDLNLHK